jgi:hypothetical protein
MPSNRVKDFVFASLAFAILATSAPVHAGPISDMIARNRQRREMRLPPPDKPFQIKPYKDPNAPGLAQRFKQRFTLKRGSSDSSFPMNHDSGVIKTSR